MMIKETIFNFIVIAFGIRVIKSWEGLTISSWFDWGLTTKTHLLSKTRELLLLVTGRDRKLNRKIYSSMNIEDEIEKEINTTINILIDSSR